ncbi:MAG: hypothetical protein ABJL99_08120 [Aliishimia sp.]
MMDASHSLALFGMLSAALSTIAYLPYINDTLRGRTHPQRASWLIWSALGSIAFASQLYEGATDSLWFAGVQVSGTIVVFLLSIRLGVGGFLNRQDCYVLLFAAGGLLAWYLTSTAVYAIAITISVSLLGGFVTVRKAYLHPQSETLSSWVCSFVAAGFAVLAVGRLDIILLAYPLYLCGLTGAIVAATLMGRSRDTSMLSRV